MPEEAKPPYMSKEVEEALKFIFKITSQLRVGEMGQAIGFDYVAVIKTAEVYNFKLTPKRMDFVRIVEREIIDRQ